jgi:3-oxoacyl-[acyl-carrier-protein] synthase II
VVLQEEISVHGNDPSRACRPFDLHRSGMVLGEGAGAVVLESLETAQGRGATILGEVIGSGSSAVMDARGVGDLQAATVNTLRQTLAGAGLKPDDVGHVNAHGVATRRSDEQEAKAIQQVFAARRSPVPVTTVKSYLGNSGAACGVIELIASVLALREGYLFPVLNYATPDEQCPVNVVRTGDVSPGDTFVNINVTPLGQASALAVRKFPGDAVAG